MRKQINVLIACEMSQTICIEMRYMGFNAFSCDLQPAGGGHPEWHIQRDVLGLIDGNCRFITQDGQLYEIYGKWDLIVAHPPCTFLSVSGNRWFDVEKYGDKAIKRIENRREAVDFFMRFANADCDCIAIENPIGIMSKQFRKPNQIVHPWHFGDPFVKSTCLWLKNLPNLEQTHFEKPKIEYKEWVDKNGRRKRQDMLSYNGYGKKTEDRQNLRSKTFPGIARAIARTWGMYVIDYYKNKQ